MIIQLNEKLIFRLIDNEYIPNPTCLCKKKKKANQHI